MKTISFTVNKKDFTRSLVKCISFVEAKGTMPILQNVMIHAHRGNVELSATDLEIGITEKVPGAQVASPGKITLPAKKLRDSLNKMGKEEGEISLTERPSSWVEIVSGKLKVKMMGLSAENFPAFPELKETTPSSEIDAFIFSQMITKTIHAASTDPSRYNLQGLFVHPRKDGLRVTATDGYRLSYVDAPLTMAGIPTPGMILPHKGSGLVAKIMNHEKFTALIEDKFFIAKQNGTTITMRMLDAEFPDYTQVVPRAMDFVIQAKLQELKDVVSRILPFTSEKTSGIQCLFAGNSLTLTGYNPEYGEAQETIEIEGDGDIEIGFNGRFLLETLDSLDGDSVLVGINDASGPVAMIPADKDDHVEIIMPMRI